MIKGETTFDELETAVEDLLSGRTVDGTYLKPNHPEIKSGFALAERWLKENPADYRTFNREAYAKDFTDELWASVEQNGYLDDQENTIKNEKVIETVDKVELLGATTSDDFKGVSLVAVQYFTVVDASDTFLQENGLEKGASYTRKHTFDLFKVDGAWKISNIIWDDWEKQN